MKQIQNKNGISYRVDYYDLNNKRKYKSFNTKTAAKKWKEDMASMKRNDPLALLRINQQISFQDLFDQWFEAKIKNKRGIKTIYQYERFYNKHLSQFANRKLHTITSYEIEKYINVLIVKKLKPKSVNNIIIFLKQIFKYAFEQNLILKNPLREVSTIFEPEIDINYLFTEEIKLLLNANRFKSIYPLLVFVLNTGLRIGEIAGLCWDCINFEKRQILVKRTLSRMSGLQEYTKTKAIRYLPMNDEVYDLLKFLWKNQKSEVFIFTDETGKSLCPDHYSSRHFKAALDLAGIKRIRFHDMRHTFASHYMMNGGNIYDLQKLLGHKDIKTTMKYAHLSPEHLLEASKVVNFKSDLSPILNVQNDDRYKMDTNGLQLVK